MEYKIHSEAAVLLITFNRPDYTSKVFQRIRQAKVKRLYVFNDGSREGNKEDVIARQEIRAMIDGIDWPCEIDLNFSENNLGCGHGPSSAISWAFAKEEKLIILEDDCVPELAFFDFCNYGLQVYNDDLRVWALVGRSHYQDPSLFYGFDYTFSHYGFTWGWATWKRTWEHYDIEMKSWPKLKNLGGFSNTFSSEEEVKFYNNRYDKLFLDADLKSHVWDYQFMFTMFSNGGLFVVPARNLVENIGYYGVHYNGGRDENRIKSTNDFEVKIRPPYVIANKKYDKYYFRHKVKSTFLLSRIKSKLLKFLSLG